MSKKYGLIISDKGKNQQPVFQATRNVFGDDSDSSDELNKKLVLLRPSDNTNRQTKITQEKAVMEDPTIYQYDEIYDSMVSKKEEKIKIKEKKPKYIENLIKSANKRKIENERRVERQIQKEREKEGEEFADKEVFVTSAYKKKLEELRQEEEKEKREEYLESIGDVTKQKDLGGFYRHLYEQKLGSDKTIEDKQIIVKGKSKSSEEKRKSIEEKRKLSDEKGSKHSDDTQKNNKTDKLDLKKRNYRKRKSSSDYRDHLSEGEIEESDEEINRVNLKDIRTAKKLKQNEENIDADSDFSIDESSDEEISAKKKEESKKSSEEIFKRPPSPDPEKENKLKAMSKNIDPNSMKEEVVVTDPKPKVDIWKKRTVGEVFEQALKRYYERKAVRGC